MILLTRPATSYGAPGRPGGTPPLLRSLFARCARALRAKGLTLVPDSRLSFAARPLLRVQRLDRVGSAGLRFVLLGHGVVEPPGRLLADTLGSGTEVLRSLQEPVVLAASSGQLNRIGGAVRRLENGRLRVVVILLRGSLSLDPLVRAPVQGATVLLRGSLAAGFASPTAVVTGPGGATVRARLTAATDGTFHALVPLSSGRGVYQVELLGTGPRGPEVLANFPLFVGVPPPTRFVLPVSGGRAVTRMLPQEVERDLLERLNGARKRSGLTALVPSAALTRVARGHSKEMCRESEVRHFSPVTGTALDRVRRAGVRALWVGENVGSASTGRELHQSFLRSPAHRAAMLRPSITHVGVGVCITRSTAGSRVVYVTELFVRAPSPRR